VLFFPLTVLLFIGLAVYFGFGFVEFFGLVNAFIATHVVREQQNIKQVRSGLKEHNSTDVLPYRKLREKNKIGMSAVLNFLNIL